MLPGEISRRTIPAGGRFSTRLDVGERLRIVDTHGQQAVDFLCYTAELPVDRYNPANTMKINANTYLETRIQAFHVWQQETCAQHVA